MPGASPLQPPTASCNRIYGQTPQEGRCRVADLDDLLAYYTTVVDPIFDLRQLSAPVSAEAFAALRLFIDRVDGFGFPEGTGGQELRGVHWADGQLRRRPGGNHSLPRDVLLRSARC